MAIGVAQVGGDRLQVAFAAHKRSALARQLARTGGGKSRLGVHPDVAILLQIDF